MFIVTCETVECENQNIPIYLEEIGDMVICGPCETEITEIIEEEEQGNE